MKYRLCKKEIHFNLNGRRHVTNLSKAHLILNQPTASNLSLIPETRNNAIKISDAISDWFHNKIQLSCCGESYSGYCCRQSFSLSAALPTEAIGVLHSVLLCFPQLRIITLWPHKLLSTDFKSISLLLEDHFIWESIIAVIGLQNLLMQESNHRRCRESCPTAVGVKCRCPLKQTHCRTVK